MTTLEVLEAAEKLLREHGTCKNRWAETAAGGTCRVDSIHAVKWCPTGAIIRIDPENPNVACRVLGSVLNPPSIPEWWDRPETTEEDLWRAFARAKEKARNA